MMKPFSVRAATTSMTIGVAALAALGTASASATVVSTPSAPSGVPAGTQIGSSLSGVAKLTRLSNRSQSVTCATGSLSGVVGSSIGAPVSVGLTAPSLDLGPLAPARTCTNDGMPFLVRSVSLTGFSAASIKAGGASSGVLTATGLTFTFQLTVAGAPGTCTYVAPSATGVLSNVDHSVTFTEIQISGTQNGCNTLGAYGLAAKFGPLTVTAGALAGEPVSVS
jgi:hypothetical protein